MTFCSKAMDGIKRLTEKRWFLAAVIVLAFVLRLAWILAVDPQQTSDFGQYERSAKIIAAGRGYVTGDGTPTAYWPIGYPQFLGAIFAATDSSAFAGKLANVFLYLGIIWLSYLLGKELFKSHFTGAITALILAIFPNHIAYSSILLSDTLFTLLMLCGIWFTLRSPHRWQFIIAAGVMFGLSALVRTQGLLVAGTLLLFLHGYWKPKVSFSRWLVVSATIIMVSLVTMLPYTIRNYRAFGHVFIGSLNGGINMLMGNNPYAAGEYIWDEKVEALVPGYAKMNEYDRDRASMRYAVRYMISHPAHTLKMYPRKIIELYGWDFDAIRWNEKGLDDEPMWPLRIVCQLFYMVVWLLAIFAFVRYWIARRRKEIINFSTVGLWIFIPWTIMHLITLGAARYHYPIVPFLAMYAAVFMSWRCKSKTEGSTNQCSI